MTQSVIQGKLQGDDHEYPSSLLNTGYLDDKMDLLLLLYVYKEEVHYSIQRAHAVPDTTQPLQLRISQVYYFVLYRYLITTLKALFSSEK